MGGHGPDRDCKRGLLGNAGTRRIKLHFGDQAESSDRTKSGAQNRQRDCWEYPAHGNRKDQRKRTVR